MWVNVGTFKMWIIPDKFWHKSHGFDRPARMTNQKVIYKSYDHGYRYNPLILGYIKGLSAGMWKIQNSDNEIYYRSGVVFVYEMNYERHFSKGDSVYILNNENENDRLGIILSGRLKDDDGLIYYKVLDGNKKNSIWPCSLRKVK